MELFVILSRILVALIIYGFYRLKKVHKYWQERGIPCENPSFLVGNLTGIRKTRTFAELWENYYKTFKGTGPFAGFYWALRPAVVVLDPQLIKSILIKDFHKFTDRNFFTNERDDPLTGQLFLLKGNRWSSMRRKLTPTFTSGKMKFMFPSVVKVGHEFIATLENVMQVDDVVEVKELLARFTTDVIGICAFGIDCQSLKDPNAEFRVVSRNSFNPKRNGLMGKLLMSSYPDLARKLRMGTFDDYIQEFFLRIVRETVELREKNNIRRNDFMDMLIDLKNKKPIGDVALEGEMAGLTLEQMTAQAFVFFAAGFETSSTTMGFTLYELARRQDIQDRLRQEIDMVLNAHNSELTYECMKEMHYMEQVISETLRLYTVLPMLSRQCAEDYEIPDHPKYTIEKGIAIIIPIGAIHRDPEFFPNPDVFDPDNFLPERTEKRDSAVYMPFGDGPRNCIGMRFGQMQMRVGLCLLLKRFQFSLCSETKIPMEYDRNSFLVSSKDGIFLKVTHI